MKKCVLFSLLLFLQTTHSSPVSTTALAQGFLEHYGYLLKDNKTHPAAELRSAIREFQWLSHLPITGRLNGRTLVMMTSSRCGVTDAGSHRAWKQRVNSILTGSPLRKKRHARFGEKWPKKQLSYRVMNWPRTLSPIQVHAAVKTAFQLWSNVSGLVFHELLQGPTDIRLAFYDGEHNDGSRNAFDGPGGALAHAFFPFRGEAHFDLSERWTLSTRKGHDLFLVSAHEIGHTLGLLHSPVQHSLMSPFYSRRRSRVLLSWDDIIAIQQLYGKPPGGGSGQVMGQTLRRVLRDQQRSLQPTEDAPESPPYCRGHFDVITTDRNGSLLVFEGTRFWTVFHERVSESVLLQTRWPRLPVTIEAAAFNPLDQKLYFFKEDRVWRFSDSDLDPGFPLSNSRLGLPKRPDCAFFYPPLRQIVLFKGSRYYLMNQNTLQNEPYYPRPLKDWMGVPRRVNGAINGPDAALYFFKEQHYWRFDPGLLQITTKGHWGEDLQWMGCKRTSLLPDHQHL